MARNQRVLVSVDFGVVVLNPVLALDFDNGALVGVTAINGGRVWVQVNLGDVFGSIDARNDFTVHLFRTQCENAEAIGYHAFKDIHCCPCVVTGGQE